MRGKIVFCKNIKIVCDFTNPRGGLKRKKRRHGCLLFGYDGSLFLGYVQLPEDALQHVVDARAGIVTDVELLLGNLREES